VPRITFIAPNGAAHTVESPVGTSVMRAAVDHDVAGIIGECGGHLVCATCHVYLDGHCTERFAPPSAMELELLGFAAAEVRPESRLGCQLILSSDCDGCTVHLPDSQVP
jgi:2Fe-2S ferredoxin